MSLIEQIEEARARASELYEQSLSLHQGALKVLQQSEVGQRYGIHLRPGDRSNFLRAGGMYATYELRLPLDEISVSVILQGSNEDGWLAPYDDDAPAMKNAQDVADYVLKLIGAEVKSSVSSIDGSVRRQQLEQAQLESVLFGDSVLDMMERLSEDEHTED